MILQIFTTIALLTWTGTVMAQEDDPIIEEKPLSQWLKQLRGDNRGLQLRAARALASAPSNAIPKE